MADEWNLGVPDDHTKIASSPQQDRNIKTNTKAIVELEHEELGDGNSGGQHRLGSAIVNEGTTTPTKTVDITSGGVALDDIARDRGRLWVDDNFDPPLLKRWDGTAWEVLGTIVGGSDASAISAYMQNLSTDDSDGGGALRLDAKSKSSGSLKTLGRLEFSHEGSSTDQKGQLKIKLNDGDDDDAPSKTAIVFKSTGKIDASESLSVLDEDNMASDDADVLVTQQSVKKYVDDQIIAQITANVPSSLTGADDSTGETAIGELQLKWGSKSVSGSSTAIDFTDEGLTDFDNACFQAWANATTDTTRESGVSVLAVTGITVVHNSDVSKIRWFAIGY